jgi:serine kinase of HPr protein (carbohydrate metabolism regulator)
MTQQPEGLALHANGVVVGEAGVMIRGPSGSGKSTLSHQLISLAHRNGHFARLIGDDRLYLTAIGGRLIAKGHPLTAGKIELRGIGIRATDFENQAVIRLLVDCEPVLNNRYPDHLDMSDTVLGISIRRITVTPQNAELVLAALGLGSLSI